MATAPTIRIVGRDDHRTCYRIEGGTLSAEWAASLRPGRVAWCEFTLYLGSDQLARYGGEVWPSAWPELFASTATQEFPRGTAQSPAGLRLTAAGRAAVDAASAA